MEVNEALPEYKRYTYADYCGWDDDVRRELIDGIPYVMEAPSYAHQKISGNLHYQLYGFTKDTPCEVLFAPFDVRLNANALDDTVVQPDLLVVCDESKLDDRGCVGVPDMAIEILSPSALMHDKVVKFNKYQQAGVREYWIVDPKSKTVSKNVLINGEYVAEGYGHDESVPVHVLEGCMIDLSEVFSK